MDKRKMKKLLILNLPYFLVGLFATNLGEAWRLAEGADSSAKILSFFHALPIALNNPFPSFHPLDLLIGILCGAGLRLAVYSVMTSSVLSGVLWATPSFCASPCLRLVRLRRVYSALTKGRRKLFGSVYSRTS